MEKLLEVNGVEYIVSDEGKIYSTKNIGRGKYHKEIKQRKNSDGYFCITVGTNGNRRTASVHRLIALAFLPNPDGLEEVDHIDNNRENNNVCNLQWITSFDNKKKIPFETRSKSHSGEMNGRSTVTENDVREMRKLYNDGMSIDKIRRKYGIPWSTASNIVKFATWKNVV